MRLLLFLAAFVVALAASAPLEKWVMPVVRGALPRGVTVDVGALRLAAPAGLRARALSIEGGDVALQLDSLYVGITRSFDAEGCGGRLAGHASGSSIALEFHSVDPSRCLRVGRLSFETVLDGRVAVEGIDFPAAASGNPAGEPRLDVDLSSPGGVFGGILSGAGKGGDDLPLGEWEFRDLVLRASLEGGKLRVEEGRAVTSGVQWELLGGDLPLPGQKGSLKIDLRARAADEGARAKALLSMMPKAAEDAGGWRRYRVTGSLAAPRIVGVE